MRLRLQSHTLSDGRRATLEPLYGGERWRFWVKSDLLAAAVSDGSTHSTIKDALRAAASFNLDKDGAE